MLCGVIFDHDGTLVDTEGQHYRIWNQLLQEFGHHLTEEDYIREHNGVPTLDSAAHLVHRYGLNLTPEQLCLAKEKRVLAWQEVPPLMPGVRETLKRLRDRAIPMAVATGARFDEVDRNLRHHNLLPMFDAVCSSSEVARNKPAPDVYLLAAKRLGLAPEHCLAVEDTPTGLQSAVAAGMRCIVIPSAPAAHYDFSAATRVCDRMDDLQQWLEQALPTLPIEPCASGV